MKKIVFLIVIIAFGFMGCNTGKEKEIKVGAVIPLTGKVATYGQSLKKGFNMAVAEYNKKIKIIYEDSKGDKNAGISAINKLIYVNNVHYIFGPATSGVTLAIAPIAQKNKVVLMDAIATSDEISKCGDYIFRIAPSNYKQAVKAASFITKELNVKNIAIIYNQTDYGVNLADKFEGELKLQKITPVFITGYQDGTTDFRTILSKLVSSHAKAVFVPGNYEETAVMLKQAKQMNINIPFVGTDGAYSPKLIKIAGNATKNFFLTMMGVDPQNKIYKKFIADYKSKYNGEPNIFTVYGYEAAKILFPSILKSADNPKKVRQYLYSNTFNSFTGQLKFDDKGDVSRSYVVLKITDNRFVNY